MVYCTGNKLVVEHSTEACSCSNTVDTQLVLCSNTAAVDTLQQAV